MPCSNNFFIYDLNHDQGCPVSLMILLLAICRKSSATKFRKILYTRINCNTNLKGSSFGMCDVNKKNTNIFQGHQKCLTFEEAKVSNTG